MAWEPPGRNCGSCGAGDCTEFLALARHGKKDLRDCPYYPRRSVTVPVQPVADRSGRDLLGFDYDFVVKAFPNEPSARRFIQPLRAELVERWAIGPGDILRGRPYHIDLQKCDRILSQQLPDNLAVLVS